MADIKHTPGPWFTFNDGKRVAGPESTIGAGQGVALCSMRARSDDEAKANALLIAAAPDLLDALKAALELLEREFPKPAPNGQIAKARRAIAKAEGRS